MVFVLSPRQGEKEGPDGHTAAGVRWLSLERGGWWPGRCLNVAVATGGPTAVTTAGGVTGSVGL